MTTPSIKRAAVHPWAKLVILPAVFLISFGGVALAANAVDPQDGSLDLAKSIYNAFSGGHYAYCAALAVILGVALLKRYLGEKVAWLHSDQGITLMALVGAAAAAMADGLAGGGPLTTQLAESSLLVGIGAAGGYHVLEHLFVEPLLKPAQAKLPPWLGKVLNILLWIWKKPAPPAPDQPPPAPEPTK